MTAHKILPLVALLMNLSLAAVALLRNRHSRINRQFIYFVTGMAVWNFGVFMLRRAPDETMAFFWEMVIHVGVISIPAFYYHFVLIFLDRTRASRTSLGVAYGLAAILTVLDLTGSPLFLKGVTMTRWGWAPVTGPAYQLFFVYFNAFLIYGLRHLLREQAAMASSFRRNRALLILLGTGVSLAGGVVDFTRFLLAHWFPVADRIYPIGIPANAVFALALGISIIRYRMFDLNAAVKKVTGLVAIGAVVTTSLVVVVLAAERYLNWGELEVLWGVIPLGFALTLALRPLESAVQRLVFSRQTGCDETLLALSKRMSGILDLEGLVDTLVRGLVRGVPLTHCVLLMSGEGSRSFDVRRAETATGERPSTRPIERNDALVQWLERHEDVLVKEEAKLNPSIAAFFVDTDASLDAIDAALIVPLKVEARLIGILLLGEKLSGEGFAEHELDVLSVLGTQAAIALENARLYEEQARLLGETQRQREEAVALEQIGREIASALDRGEVFQRIVDRARELCGSDLAFLAPYEPGATTPTIRAQSGGQSDLVSAATAAPGAGAAQAVLDTGKPFVTDDYPSDSRVPAEDAAAAAREGFIAAAVVPLRWGVQITGLLWVVNHSSRAFATTEVSVLTKLADQAAIALENSRLFAELRAALRAIEESQQRVIQGERIRALGEMAGGIAHDFNNILAIIIGRAQLLLRKLPPSEVREKLEVIEKVAKDGARTVKRIQEFTRKSRARPFAWVDLNDVVAETIEMTRSRWEDEAHARGLRYDVALEPMPVPRMAGDASELREALTNMVFNALDAMPDGGRLAIRTFAEGEWIGCSIVDNGLGMTDEVRRRVFEPFFTTKGERGNGLGLSVVYGIVKRHGGEIDVESSPGVGSTFTLRLPIGHAVPAASTRADAEKVQRSATVLVIEDEAKVREILTELLTGEGHEVVACGDGDAGLAALDEHLFDLVISDLGLPGMSGWDVAHQVKLVSPSTPVALLTGWGDLIDPDEARAKGVDFLLSKPFALEDVVALIAAAVT